MQVITASLILLVIQQTGPDAFLERAAAEVGRIESFDVWYDTEVRNLHPLAPQGGPMKVANSAPAPVGDSENLRHDAPFLKENDRDALRKHARVRFIRKAQDFLVSFQGLWVKESNWASTSDLALGCKDDTAIIYRSVPKYEDVVSRVPLNIARGILREAATFPGFGRFGLGGFGPFQEGRMAMHIVHPEVVFDLLLESQMTPRFFFTSSDHAAGLAILKIVHAIGSGDGLPSGQIAVTTTVDDNRLKQPHRSRIMVFEPSRLPMPIRVEIWKQANLQRVWEIDWREFVGASGEKVWFPTRVRQDTYSLVPGVNFGKIYMVAKANLDLSCSRVNPLLSDNELHFVFPADTFVSDEKNGQEYTVTAEGISAEVRLNELFRKAAAHPNRPWFNLFNMGIAFILLVALLCLVRLRRSTKSKPFPKSENC